MSVSSFDIAGLGSSLTESTLATGDLLAVADIDDDGILELLISNGESYKQPLNLFKANVEVLGTPPGIFATQ